MHSRSILAVGVAAVLWACPCLAAVSTTADGLVPSTEEHGDLRGDAEAGQSARPGWRLQDRTAAAGNTGVRNLDMLLEMQGRSAESTAQADATRQAAPRLRDAASAARAVPAKRDLGTVDDDDESVTPTRERRWTATSTTASSGDGALQTSSGGESNDSASTGYRGDLHGFDLANTPTRKLLLFLRNHREWVAMVVAAVALGLFTMRASARRGRKAA